MVFFALQKLFGFMRSHLLILDFSSCTISVLFRKLSPVPIISRLIPIFFSIRFSVSGFMLKFLNHLDLSFVQCDRYGSICLLLHEDISLTSSYWKCCLFSSAYFWLLYLKKSWCLWVSGVMSSSSIQFHWSTCLFFFLFHTVFFFSIFQMIDMVAKGDKTQNT